MEEVQKVRQRSRSGLIHNAGSKYYYEGIHGELRSTLLINQDTACIETNTSCHYSIERRVSFFRRRSCWQISTLQVCRSEIEGCNNTFPILTRLICCVVHLLVHLYSKRCAFAFASKEESAEDAGRSTEEGERNTADGRTSRLKSRASKLSSEEFPKRENGKSVRLF